MRRRRFLLDAAATAALLTLDTNRSLPGISLRLTVSYEDSGQTIASGFIGLSYESAILAGGDYFTPDNASTLGLIRSLGPNGVLRIGGNTSERTVWAADVNHAEAASFVITPATIDRLAAALRALGWKLIYGLNLAHGTPTAAAEEAAYVANAVGSNLLAFQIGNEPDGFGRWTAARPASYDVSAYLAEWRTFQTAIRARVPGAPLAGPDVSGASDWVAAFAQTMPQGLVLLTHHYYADGPAGAPDVSLPKLLQSNRQIRPLLERLALYSRTYRLPYRITEANSVYDEGQPGVSDTLGAALWGLELMFRVAGAGAVGINFHGGVHNRRASENKAYTPIARDGDRYRATPLYYGILMFAQAARGALIPAHLAPESSGLRAFAVRTPEGAVRICLINLNITHDERVAIEPGRKFTSASMLRLAGPAIDATAGLTLGGASVDEFGGWAPLLHEEVHLTSNEILVDVPAASAALVSLRS
ncbi:MAG: hypothetical protein C5B56_07945 [Proteobacteria bacterium]|nr:MAG: hypothetical protein C5B56_07945 [Pseudomonadota bacterium]